MNKIIKGVVALLGGCDFIFGIVTPIFISLLLINTVDLTQFNSLIILLVGFLSTMYRTLKIWVIK